MSLLVCSLQGHPLTTTLLLLLLLLLPSLCLPCSRLNRRYMNAIAEMPLYLAQMAPRARVPATTYVPPPLQCNGLGWYPEFNKVWEWFGMPGYSY